MSGRGASQAREQPCEDLASVTHMVCEGQRVGWAGWVQEMGGSWAREEFGLISGVRHHTDWRACQRCCSLFKGMSPAATGGFEQEEGGPSSVLKVSLWMPCGEQRWGRTGGSRALGTRPAALPPETPLPLLTARAAE